MWKFSDIDENGQKFQLSLSYSTSLRKIRKQSTILKEFEMKKFKILMSEYLLKNWSTDMSKFIHTSIMKSFQKVTVMPMVRIMVWSFWSIGLGQ